MSTLPSRLKSLDESLYVLGFLGLEGNACLGGIPFLREQVVTPMKIVSPNVKEAQHPQQLKPPTGAQMFAQGEESTSDKGEGGSEENREDRQCTYINLLSLNHNPNPDPNQQPL